MVQLMRQSLHTPSARGKKLRASVCLLAIFLLWSPLWAAAWQTNTMSCCADGMCPIHGHAHSAGSPAQAPSEPAADCEHDSSTKHGCKPSGMTPCSLSCCHDTTSSLIAAAIFVLPAPAAISHSVVTTSAPLQMARVAFPPSLDPASPPPRTAPQSF